MLRQICLSLCRNRVNPSSRQKVLGHGVFPCRDIALYVAIVGQGTVSQLGCVRAIEALSRQCGVVLRHDREGYAHVTDQARCA